MVDFLKELYYKVYAFCADLATRYWWVWWSNFRWRDKIRQNIGIADEDVFQSYKDIAAFTRRVSAKFTYESDGVDELFDSVTPPPQVYHDYCVDCLSDDCDGFHSVIYHCLYNNQLETYLLTVNAIGCGHCVSIFKYDDGWHVLDYSTVYSAFPTVEDAVAEYNKKFTRIYSGVKSDVLYNALLTYDYDKGKLRFYKRVKVD